MFYHYYLQKQWNDAIKIKNKKDSIDICMSIIYFLYLQI